MARFASTPVVETREEALHRLGEDMCDIQRLLDWQMRLRSEVLLHTVFDSFVVREAPFVWRERHEHRREPNLLDKVNQSCMMRVPELGREAVLLHGSAHRGVDRVFLGSQ